MINAIKKNRGILLVVSKHVGVEENADKTNATCKMYAESA
jgi:hypothetical protein